MGDDDRYKQLPEPVRPEDTVTSVETEPVPWEKDDWLREQEWMLKTVG